MSAAPPPQIIDLSKSKRLKPSEYVYDLKAENLQDIDRIPYLEMDNRGCPCFKHLKVIEVIAHLGYRRYINAFGNTFFVHDCKNIIRKVDVKTDVRNAFLSFLQERPYLPYKRQDFLNWEDKDNLSTFRRDDVLEKYIKGIGTYITEDKMNFLPTIHWHEFQKASENEQIFYFKNVKVSVKADGITTMPYSSDLFTSKVWEEQILPYEYEYAPKYTEDNFYKFTQRIAGSDHQHTALMQITGYLLHGYFENKRKLINFTDGRVTDFADGRSGKTLLVKAIGRCLNPTKESRNYSEIDGKTFDANNRFKYQRLVETTKLVHFNDAKPTLDIESLYTAVTEGLDCEKKGMENQTIYANIIVSSNKPLKPLLGSSDRDRVIEFELADHYSDKLSPQDEFGEWFFQDWDASRWNNFFTFFFESCKAWFEKGFPVVENKVLAQRKVMENVGEELDEFFHGMYKVQVTGGKTQSRDTVKVGQEYDAKILYTEFAEQYSDFVSNYKNVAKKEFGMVLFSKRLRTWCALTNRRCEQRKSHGRYYLMIVSADAPPRPAEWKNYYYDYIGNTWLKYDDDFE
jgi:hypothetical protein